MNKELLSLIPHRPPFLFVDSVVAMKETEIMTEKKVLADDFFFQGHYPGNPIMPGVLICEAIFQSAAILIARLLKETTSSTSEQTGVPVLTRIQETKFKKIVRPGDLLQIKATLIEKIGGAYFMKGEARVEGKVTVRVQFSVTQAKL